MWALVGAIPSVARGLQQDLAIARHSVDCKGLFLDMGVNKGRHANFLFEPRLYPDAVNMTVFMADVFDGVPRQNVCYFGIEANPASAKDLFDLRSCYKSHGYFVEYSAPTALWIEDIAELPLLHAKPGHDDVGAHVGMRSATPKTSAVDAVHWMETALSKARKGARVPVMGKMDIEGAEWEVIPHIVEHAPWLFCAEWEEGARGARGLGFTAITIEFHPQMLTAKQIEQGRKGWKTITLMQHKLLQELKLPGCRAATRFVYLDCEAYMNQDVEGPTHLCPSAPMA